MNQLRLMSSEVADLWGCEKEAPTPKERTRMPAPSEKPERKLR